MSDDKPKAAPREWWIKTNYPGTLCFESEITITGPVDWDSDKNNWQDFIDKKASGDAIHVIEYSAYEALESRCAKLEAALGILTTGVDDIIIMASSDIATVEALGSHACWVQMKAEARQALAHEGEK